MSSTVTPAIAASIVYVTAENFIARDFEGRWRITFLFGLAHGLGFASALQELGLPRHALPVALAAFNLGVETGQIAIVALIVPARLAFDRMAGTTARDGPACRAPAVHAASGAIVLLGCYWFVMRTLAA